MVYDELLDPNGPVYSGPGTGAPGVQVTLSLLFFFLFFTRLKSITNLDTSLTHREPPGLVGSTTSSTPTPQLSHWDFSTSQLSLTSGPQPSPPHRRPRTRDTPPRHSSGDTGLEPPPGPGPLRPSQTPPRGPGLVHPTPYLVLQ